MPIQIDELTLPEFLQLLNLVALVCENQPLVQIKKKDDMTVGQHLALVADLAVRVSNATTLLKKLDSSDYWHTLLSLPRDGVRWKDRD